MAVRAIAVRQADIARVMRAVKSAGILRDVRVVVEQGRVIVEAARERGTENPERPDTSANEEIVPL